MQLVQHVLPTSALILSPGALSGPPMFNWHLTPARRAGRGYAVLPNHDKPASLPPAPPTATPVAYGTWLDRFPAGARPYLFLLRLDKPVGTWLLYWPCAWSILMAAYHQQAALGTTVGMLALFGTGALIMRGAGCVINDMWDKDIDARVERTTTRPIAAGIISRRAALVFLGAQLTGGLAVLTQLNWYSIGLGMASMPFVIVYPLMKRITYWPQFVLGLAFNWGALLGWAALAGETHWAVTLPLYAAGVSWTLVYDTIYAHQDKRDDRLVGTRSTALLFGDRSRTVLSLLSAQTVALLCLAGYANDHGLIYYLTTVVGAGGHLAWQLATVDFDNTRDCWRKFESNVWLGALIAGGVGGDYLYRRYRTDTDGNQLATRVEGDSLSATAE
ncbi:Para-hydroxybenzoate--polyprenyltransferase, mitochondrial precursor (PHB:polyprenyltransferase) [Tieghemiomyces parasiticus]|uniref:4-hydroxybenzoate polyprenyltransferase, mitochondrial n=1 Tax=Tieghemiomyces parasiticus TaxID=78921 RepID=A0A9W8AF12_9FUNG|nr:Para-hydroxybenzoate--polyprenyltransferase, mitochondrial precursor (PHB:polyprenyltransferase) [Tieghemiomyces parasiticus]